MDFYSRMVRLLKVLLPLAALVLLSTLFLISRSIGPTADIPFAEDEIADRMRDQQVTKPYFSSTTPAGEEITVTASRARPGGTDAPAVVTDLNGWLKLADGKVITLTSDTGEVRMNKNQAKFLGNVLITSTDGLRITTDELHSALRGIAAQTPREVAGSGIIGDFTAGNMDITTKNGDGPVHMLFKNGVKLVYLPQKSER
ncbi:hypothetical protein DS909_13400 [Phaeobacter gallaeciensis]|uniref:LPS export ABC transporter periplasmic protein LptC n=2 Tax=Roseobacteraceae TaxID=2854170 RepID=A0A366X0D1_9RHOB|nr:MULTISPECIES: LPS export ABC transporter periplasmic protein LptC [Roseobacteraceae]MBT3142159.1 LPS export ABC transporter periplasmic protein LptC [Falsiruegeria litorea]MBT8168496.1 LPS export ABC transporter periplasmic protein LptC [Falsiruegeria litorea]RBW54019.1 hypothetical protein DS909_13400 [Phaeobacter gallaeciensis]